MSCVLTSRLTFSSKTFTVSIFFCAVPAPFCGGRGYSLLMLFLVSSTCRFGLIAGSACPAGTFPLSFLFFCSYFFGLPSPLLFFPLCCVVGASWALSSVNLFALSPFSPVFFSCSCSCSFSFFFLPFGSIRVANHCAYGNATSVRG